ncbi:hypothetical protein L5515_007923 [Caenorhabditis briggsae]|uniref:Minichromosome loss protein Mcl1 middle region domain-containing protein n=1 Tax=Caenorhabditis briggsae TaxID=6238 RepID=A0AAE9EZX4_CAEBR|nr:hypothetical protein L5515_007923 [Caenorhabditis briggsae]
MSFTNIKNLENIGLQKICIDSSGTNKEHVYVCDAERNVLRFDKKSLLSDEKPTIIEIPDATTSSITWYGENICFGYRKVDFIMGSEQQMIGRAKNGNFDEAEISGPLEFQMDVTAVDANEENVVGGSSDYAVKCISLKDADAELKTRSLEAEVLCVKLDPRNEFIAVSTVDGIVTIIDIESFSIVHTITNAFPKFETIDVSKPRIEMSWSKNGNWLFVPSKDCIKSYGRNGWQAAGSYWLKDRVSTTFSVSAVSACGKYLAGSTMDNHVAVWDCSDLELLSDNQFKRNAPGVTIITSIEFSPFSQNQLIIADSNRGICVLNTSGGDTDGFSTDKLDQGVTANESDDDDDSIILNRTALKKDSLFNDEAMDDEDEETRLSSDIGAIKRQYNFENQDIGGLEEFGFKVGEPEDVRLDMKQENTVDPMLAMYAEPPAPRKILIPERFVCNSSPVDPNATQRFLKYNRAGIVRSYVNEANKVSTIDIEFHDKNIHGDIHIDNFDLEYELADIALKVVALASLESRRKEKDLDKLNDEIEDLETDADVKEKKGTSVLHVIPIQAFDSQRWSMTLPRGDGCVDVLCSSSQVVVLTKKRNIRIFTIGGIQRQIFTHSSPILTAACFENRVAIASVSGSEFYEQKKTPQWKFEVVEYSLDQKSWYKESRTNGTTGAVTRMDIPVETGEQLDWLSYSNQGKLAIMDSACNVHVLSAPGLWVPVFQGSSILRNPSDGIFPIVMTTKEFRYIYCRGSKYPIVNGVNAPTTTEWKVPFCQPESVRTEMEHNLFLNELSLADAILERNEDRSSDETKKLTATIVKLFALLTKTNSDGQAAEVAALVSSGSSKTIQSLCNYASKCKKVALAEKVAEIGRQMTEVDDDRKAVEEIRPTKRIALAPRKLRKAPSPLEEEEDRDEEGNDDNREDISSRYNSNLDISISSQPVQPLERLAKNPFAKGTEKSFGIESTSSTQASMSIFDQLETVSTDQRKRTRENEPAAISSNPTARKQAKLKFGSSVTPSDEQKVIKPKQVSEKLHKSNEKENGVGSQNDVEEPRNKSVSPYEMWLAETKSNLQFEYEGEEADFSKYCIQTFRALSKDQKEEWKAKAIAVAQN